MNLYLSFLVIELVALIGLVGALRYRRLYRGQLAATQQARFTRRQLLRQHQQRLEAARAGNWQVITHWQVYDPDPPLDGRRAAFVWRDTKRQTVGKAILKLKYAQLDTLQAQMIAATLAPYLQSQYVMAGWRVDVITAVPSDEGRQQERGFNQAALLAIELARLVGVPYRPLLHREKRTAAQAGLTTEADRQANIAGAFGSRRCAGAVLVVDDIATTGATLTESARALKAAGAATVYAVTLGGGEVWRRKGDTTP